MRNKCNVLKIISILKYNKNKYISMTFKIKYKNIKLKLSKILFFYFQKVSFNDFKKRRRNK